MGLHVLTSIVGKVIEVRPLTQTFKGAAQEIIVRRPKFVHGGKINDNYPVIFFGQSIDELQPQTLLNKWINITVYINGKSYPDENGQTQEKVVLSAKDLIVLPNQ